jgi:hypothetical protein
MMHNTETPTGHRGTIISSPLLLLLELLHWTHHPNTLSILTLSIPHTSISAKVRNTETTAGHRITVTSQLSHPYPLTHHPNTLSIPMLSLPHTSFSVKVRNNRDNYRTPHSRYILTMTPLSLDSPPWNHCCQ